MTSLGLWGGVLARHTYLHPARTTQSGAPSLHAVTAVHEVSTCKMEIAPCQRWEAATTSNYEQWQLNPTNNNSQLRSPPPRLQHGASFPRDHQDSSAGYSRCWACSRYTMRHPIPNRPVRCKLGAGRLPMNKKKTGSSHHILTYVLLRLDIFNCRSRAGESRVSLVSALEAYGTAIVIHSITRPLSDEAKLRSGLDVPVHFLVITCCARLPPRGAVPFAA